MTYRRGNILKKQTYRKSHLVLKCVFFTASTLNRSQSYRNYPTLQVPQKKKNVKLVTYIKRPFPSYSVLLPACFCLSQKYIKYITRIYQI